MKKQPLGRRLRVQFKLLIPEDESITAILWFPQSSTSILSQLLAAVCFLATWYQQYNIHDFTVAYDDYNDDDDDDYSGDYFDDDGDYYDNDVDSEDY